MVKKKQKGGPGRPRLTQNGFRFKLHDLKIEIFRSYTAATAKITHLPTGIVVEGHDFLMPGSTLAARNVAMHMLQRELEEHERETHTAGQEEASDGPGEAAGTPGTPGR